MSKVYLAVDRDGTEAIFDEMPEKDIKNCLYCTGDMYAMFVVVPTGTIRRLIGRDLTWEDEPVELSEELAVQKWITNRILNACSCGGQMVHETDMNSHPYGDKIEFDRCLSCGETYNVKVFKPE